LIYVVVVIRLVVVCKGDCLSAGKPRRDIEQTERGRHQDWYSTDDLQHSGVQLAHSTGRHTKQRVNISCGYMESFHSV